MKNNRTHDEFGAIKPEAKLSGIAYVVVTLRDTDDPSGRILLMPNPDRCNHGYTICVECADSWELDHHLHYELTGGGRRLREALDTARRATTSAESAQDDSREPATDAAETHLASPGTDSTVESAGLGPTVPAARPPA
ncbi:hypothetical protein [Nocardia asteroides]|uniref:hypothetical protein n=1 Tax=Nocardia asteroides TaxID=1824 RepID=UPI001E3DA6DA|nr:hypothetical protein [Nocardia asteroides]UGT53986.1 hypothetical protein LTT85_25490 [Nocardia asteroides]